MKKKINEKKKLPSESHISKSSTNLPWADPEKGKKLYAIGY